MIEEIKKMLWASADKLRANMDPAEYKHIVLGLIFLKYISDSFQTHRIQLTLRFQDSDDDYYLSDTNKSYLVEELEDRDYYRESNVFWVPEGARWETIRSQAKQPDIGKRIDEAFAEKMLMLTEALGEQMAKGAELDELISQKLGGLGYEF
jgi:type I restriction enzyme M protein